MKYNEEPIEIPAEPALEPPYPATLEESLATRALANLFKEVGNSNAHKLQNIRINKAIGVGTVAYYATGSIRVHFVGQAISNDGEVA